MAYSTCCDYGDYEEQVLFLPGSHLYPGLFSAEFLMNQIYLFLKNLSIIKHQ
jgi:hypothetical protein